MGGDSLDLAWAAGYLDGEGAFLTGPNGRHAEITVHSVAPASVDKLQRMFGGTRSFEKRRDFRSRHTHRWRIYGKDARWVAGLVLETGEMVVKAEQARAVRDCQTYPAGSQALQNLLDRARREKDAEYNADGTPGR